MWSFGPQWIADFNFGGFMKIKSVIISSVLAATASISLPAHAIPIIFTGSSGALAASASFDIVGGQLQIVLANISGVDVLVPSNVLTGMFFNVNGNPALARLSALSNGTTYLGAAPISGAGTVVGGEWGYKNGLAQYGANTGISSSGLGLFGPPNLFPGANLAGPASPDGLQYGLTSAGDNSATGNGGIMGNELTKSAVTFMLGSLSAGFTLADISNVTFQYGTALSDPHFPGNGGGGGGGGGELPEPGTLTLFGLGALALAARRKRKA